METKQIHVAAGTQVLTILEGKALPLREKQKVAISGTIDSPKIFLQKRKGNVSTDHVTFSKGKMFIKYVVDENNDLGTEITGSLVLNDDLVVFGINKGKEFTPKALASFLKQNRIFFSDKEQNALIVTALNSFQATIASEIEKAQDQRGNSKQLVEKKVTSNTPTNFTLQMPIFLGEESKRFNVEICIDVTDAGVKCWLESPEMNDIFLTERDKIISSEIEAIQSLLDCPIIELI